jgi:hypothetical protein
MGPGAGPTKAVSAMSDGISATELVVLPLAGWSQTCAPADQQQALRVLEAGGVLFFPNLGFQLAEGEERLLTPAVSGQGKNISLDPATGVLRGSEAGEAELGLLQGMMMRFAASSRALMSCLLPAYGTDLKQARTSFRPIEVSGRSSSWRKDDTRLHVDSFPSSPTGGERILRVFTNINSQGRARLWRLGEPFTEVARRYIYSIPDPVPGSSLALKLLGLTRSWRSPYDHYMLRLHDAMKADLDYQETANQRPYAFPAGSTWMVFTDMVSHAAMAGQHALEQTLHLPVDSMLDPTQSPLRILERELRRRLA